MPGFSTGDEDLPQSAGCCQAGARPCVSAGASCPMCFIGGVQSPGWCLGRFCVELALIPIFPHLPPGLCDLSLCPCDLCHRGGAVMSVTASLGRTGADCHMRGCDVLLPTVRGGLPCGLSAHCHQEKVRPRPW